MRVLRALTLVYTLVLVVAVAASLIAILVYLLRINAVLKEIAGALSTVRDRTAPLAGPLTLVQEVAVETTTALTQTGTDLGRVDEGLGVLTEQLGATEPAR